MVMTARAAAEYKIHDLIQTFHCLRQLFENFFARLLLDRMGCCHGNKSNLRI